MNNYFDTYNKNDCNGCGTCSLKCPKNAITMQEDEEGFLYPTINKEKCINCGLCKRICSNNPIKENKIETYIAVNKDMDILRDSSSGGMFSIISKYVLTKKGLVFGVKYDDSLNVIHDYVEDFESLKVFRHSKYVRSDLKDSYKKVESFLKKNRYVLFTGTPCQCAGLRSYLMKNYDKLITCDLICHANSSPKVFNMFKKNIEYKYGSKISKIDFRDKEKEGWHSGNHTTIKLTDKKEYDIPEYTTAFQNELINRPSCHNCRFCTIKRYSDFTIGDLWGIENVSDIVDDNTGISLLSVNTDKAKIIFNEIKDYMNYHKIDINLAFKYNHNSNVPYNKNRTKFFNGIVNGKINEKNVINYLKKYQKKSFARRILGKIKSIIKK